MEGKKPSSSSFTHDLFGAANESPPSHTILSSIFPPPPKGPQGETSRWSESEKKCDSAAQPTKKPDSGEEEQSWSTTGGINSYFQDENQQHPFHYSSSIYYGGQDVYSRPKTAENPDAPTFNEYTAEDNPDVASRGNWWQGSLYY